MSKFFTELAQLLKDNERCVITVLPQNGELKVSILTSSDSKDNLKSPILLIGTAAEVDANIIQSIAGMEAMKEKFKIDMSALNAEIEAEKAKKKPAKKAEAKAETEDAEPVAAEAPAPKKPTQKDLVKQGDTFMEERKYSEAVDAYTKAEAMKADAKIKGKRENAERWAKSVASLDEVKIETKIDVVDNTATTIVIPESKEAKITLAEIAKASPNIIIAKMPPLEANAQSMAPNEDFLTETTGTSAPEESSDLDDFILP